MAKALRRALYAVALTLAPVASSGLICAGSHPVFANQGRNDPSEHRGYSLASITGNYAVVGTYSANLASVFGVLTFDGLGTLKGSATVNQPGPNGSRTIAKVTVAGTYSVERDGTGTMSVTVMLSNGTTSDVTEDFVITKAESRGGMLIATSIFDAQQQPSVLISGDVFVTHTYTRRPD